MNEPAHGLRERAKLDKLRRIEKAARRLFKKGGYDATTTRAIADAAGIGIGTLFLYFPEKLDLLAHLYERDLAQVTGEALDRLPAEISLVDGCVSVFESVFAFYDQDTALARAFIKEFLFLPATRQPESFQLLLRFTGRLGDLVAACQARGELRADVAPQFAAHQIFGLYYWCLTNWLGGRFPGPPQLGALMRMSLELLVRGLEPRL